MSEKEQESVPSEGSETNRLRRLLLEQATALQDEALRAGGQLLPAHC